MRTYELFVCTNVQYVSTYILHTDSLDLGNVCVSNETVMSDRNR